MSTGPTAPRTRSILRRCSARPASRLENERWFGAKARAETLRAFAFSRHAPSSHSRQAGGAWAVKCAAATPKAQLPRHAHGLSHGPAGTGAGGARLYLCPDARVPAARPRNPRAAAGLAVLRGRPDVR